DRHRHLSPRPPREPPHDRPPAPPGLREGSLADIAEHPEDDTPRLIFADWGEDNGEPERAEFIRLQIALRRRDGGNPRVPGLWLREEELWEANKDRWRLELPEGMRSDAHGTRTSFRRGFAGDFFGGRRA